MPDRPAPLTREFAERLAGSLTPVMAGCAPGARVSLREVHATECWTVPAPPASLLQFGVSQGREAVTVILRGSLGPDLARLLLGGSATGSAEVAGADETDALQELANQTAGSVCAALSTLLGRPIAFESPRATWLGAGAPWPAMAEGAVLLLDVSATGLVGEAHLVLPRQLCPPSAAAEAALPPLEAPSQRRNGGGLELLMDVMLPLTVELGRTRMPIRDILHLAPGSIVELDKLAGEPVELRINDKVIARGEVVVIDENFGVRLTNIVTPAERVDSFR